MYKLNPLFLFLREYFAFDFFLGEMEVHADHGYKQVDTEKTAYDDEDDEENDSPLVVVFDGACFGRASVHRLEQVLRPAFQRRQHEQRYHRS